MNTVFEPISLGYTCEIKYQLSRALYQRADPEGSEDAFRRLLFTPDLGHTSFERQLFDWQITPFEAVIAYLEHDFRGVFEREDLTVSADGAEAVHRILHTRHPHEFKSPAGPLTEAMIDRAYADARAKFDHLAERFRQLLGRPGPYLYVFRQIRIYDDAVKLAALLAARSPQHRFRLLFVDFDGDSQIIAPVNGAQVFKGWVPLVPHKPPERRWEGDDAHWDAILEPFRLGRHA